MPGIFFLAPGAVFQDPNAQVVHSNATVTVTGEAIVTGYGATEVTLFINVKAAPTGTSPTLQYTIQEVDPGDGLTNIGPSVSSTVITGIGIQKISLVATFGGSIHVSWVVTGTTPSFTQVYATLVGKSGSIALVDSTGAAISSANPLRTDPTGSTTQPVSGTVTGNQGTPNTIGNSWPVEVTDGTNVLGTLTHPVRTDPTGTTTQPVSGTVTVQQATAANLNATVTQGPAATLAGYWTVRVTDGTNTMPMGDVVGRAIYHLLTDGTNTAAVTASSALKVDGSAVTQPVSGTVTSNQGTGTGASAPWSVELSDGAAFYTGAKTGQFPSALVGGRLDTNLGAWLGSTAPTVGQKTSANSLPIVIASDQSAIPVTISAGSDRTSTGTITSNQNVAVSTQASGTCGVQVTGTWTGTLVFESTVDGGTTWNPVNAEVPTTGAEVTTTTVNGVWVIACAGFEQVRVRGNTVATGTATIFLNSSTATQVVILGDPLPTGSNVIGAVTQSGGPWGVSGTVTSNQGTAAGAGAPWAVRLSDGAAFYDGTKTGQLPAALVGGRLDANVGAWLGSTAPTVGQKTMADSVPITIASDQTVIPVSQNGTWTVQQGTPPWSVAQSGTWTVQQGTPPWQVVGPGAAGSAVTGNPVIMGGSDGTNARYVSVDSSGRLVMVQATASLLNATVTQGPAAALSGYWPVRITDGTNTLPTADVAARKAFFALTDGTNTTAVKAASTAAAAADPSAVVALSPNSPLPAGSNTIGVVNQGTPASLANKWPVQVTDGTNTMPTGDAVGRALFEKITDGTNTAAVKAASTTPVAADPALVVVLSPNTPTISTTPAADQFPATQNITVQDTGSTTTTGANGQTIVTGTPTANSAASFALVSQETCQVQVTGTWTGTLQVEVSVDNGTTWYVRRLHQVGTDIISASYTQNFSGAANTGAYTNIRVRATAAMTGTAVVKVTESVNNNSIYVANAVRITDNAGHYFRMDTDGTAVFTPRNDDGSIGNFNFGGDNRLRVGQESLLFFDTFEGNTVNNYLWTQSSSGMSQVQSNGVITLNNGNSTTAGNYSILTSTKSLFLTSEFPIYAQFKARLIPQTNAVIEVGFGVVATTAAPTNGCFFRIDSAGNMRAVINFGGTETTSATLGTLTSTNYYSFEVVIHEDSIRVDIDNADGTTFASVELPIPATQAALMTTSHIPLFARVYNSGTPTTAANILLSSVSVQQLDLAMVATWEEQMAGTGRGATADPQTGSQLQNFTNSAAPSTITVATLSNVTPAYTTFGGLFAFNTPAGGETDYLLFAYQIPDGFTAMIWAVQIGCVILGAQSSTSPTVLQWGIAVGSSAASLATGVPNPPIRQTLGFQQAPKTATIGDTYSPANLTYSPKVPLVCFGGKYVQIILRVVAGNATAGQINRGFVNIDGFFQ